VRLLVAVLATLSAALTHTSQPDVHTIIQRSVQVNNQDWQAAPEYDYFVREQEDEGTKTYQVLMILASPYYRTVAVDGKPLSPEDQQKEQHKLDEVMARRRRESRRERAERIAKYQKDRKRDHLLLEQLVKAFDFRLKGEQKVDGYDAYVLQAAPRPGYQPPNVEAQVLTGMVGELWIEKNTLQWVKVEATVVRPVTIEGFLARVQPGTRFELENMPVAGGAWLTKHFSMSSRSKILFCFHTKHKRTRHTSGIEKVET
jgi:hypothetical protein